MPVWPSCYSECGWIDTTFDYGLELLDAIVNETHDMYLQIHSILSLPNQSGITTGAFYSNSASCFPYFPPSTTHHDVMHTFQETVSPSNVEHGKKYRNWGAQKIL